MAAIHFTFMPIPFSSRTAKNNCFPRRNFRISANFQENPAESQSSKSETQDSIKLAFAKAEASKDSISSSPSISGPDEVNDGGENKKEVPLAVKLALEKAREYKKNKGTSLENFDESPFVESNGVNQRIDGLKSGEVTDVGGDNKYVPLAVKLGMEKAKDYKKNKEVLGSTAEGTGGSETLDSGVKGGNVQTPGDNRLTKNSSKMGQLSVSSIDFMGLGFADKKSGRALPAGLVPISDPFPAGDISEVEIIIGDKSKFDDTVAVSKSVPNIEDDDDLYKPKVSTWGVFARPKDISKAYGGGRTIRPGEALESKEERAAKEARTRQLLDAYKSKTGVNIDPELKTVCEKL